MFIYFKCETNITEKKKPWVTAMDGVKALEIVEAAVESSTKNKVVELN